MDRNGTQSCSRGNDEPSRFMLMNLFCQGPPGTGKCHVATILALAAIDRILGVVQKPSSNGSSWTRNTEGCEEFKGGVLV